MNAPLKRGLVAAIAVLLLAAAAGGIVYFKNRPGNPQESAPAGYDATMVAGELQQLLVAYRKIIVLLAPEKSLSADAKAAANQVGQALFHENLGRVSDLSAKLDNLVATSQPSRFDAIGSVLDTIESAPDMYDADRLAFRELLRSLQRSLTRDSSLQAIKMHKRVGDDLDALAEIERNYEKEIAQIFSRFETRAIELKRERWNDYVAHIASLYPREQILKDYGTIVPYARKAGAKETDDDAEIFGTHLPPKTVVLTFDDGPHPAYTPEVVAILKQYGVPAVFFQVGRNLGSLDSAGHVKLGASAEVSRSLKQAGFEIGNHSFTHAQLSKTTGDALKAEIFNTDALLKAVDKQRSPLFRFPYGARNAEGMRDLAEAHLKSVMWNVDSLDWADPVPRSIADRVLRSVDQAGHGIILFHDIHERTLKALPLVLDRLTAEGYQFAGWDGQQFTVAKAADSGRDKAAVTTGYNNSWAVVIGIDDYQKWPHLQYAVKDAQAIREVLIGKFGFASERVVALTNGDATRNGILAAFHDRLAHGGMQKNDRVLVFFAGHGATRKLSSGRDVGYIIPVDSDPNEFANDAIAMTEIQNVAESLDAKHVFFIMDACYSGLGLTRGSGGSAAYLRDNAKRIGRQMLTAGGADQPVADGGPNGHSIFTWTVLQGLAGKGDLNGDGLITATELAAYVAPAVAGVSHQTPAFGSLPGSEGGEFVLELKNEPEYLNADSAQLDGKTIALNAQLDAANPAAAGATAGKTVTVTMKDLQGVDHSIVAAPPSGATSRQLAQHANERGLQYYKEQRYSDAETQFTEALKLRPDFALAANNLGFVYYKQAKYAEAARWFENTIKIDPSRAIAYINLGDAYAHAGDKDKAQKAYKTYLELSPAGAGAAHAKQQLEQL